jgi:diguanylate cyclase (GGDEF)-like protein
MMVEQETTRPAVARVLLVAGLMLAVGAGVIRLHPVETSMWGQRELLLVATAALGFAISERFAYIVQYRREAISYSLTELPMALCIVYLDMWQALVAAALGSLMIAISWRPSWYKLLFNLSLVFLELSVVYWLFDVIQGSSSDTGVRFALALLVSLIVGSLIDSVFIALAISFFEGDFFRRLGSTIRLTFTMLSANSVAATIIVGFSVVWGGFALVGLVPLAAVWAVLRRNGISEQRLRDFEALSQLTDTVSRSLHQDEIAAGAIHEVGELLRSDRAAIVLYSKQTGEAWTAAQVGEPFEGLPTRVDEGRWRPFVEADGASLIEPTALHSLGVPLVARGNLIVVPVRDGAGVLGLLIIGERIGPLQSFDASDALRANAIAGRLSSALRNAELHELIEEEAWRDRLTGLPNRNSFERALVDAQETCSLNETLAVIVFGIDRFRDVNETLGHQVGDAILIELSRRLADEVDQGAVLARVTGDEFGLLIAPCDVESLTATARHLVDVMKRPLVVDGIEIIVDVGAGVATCSLCGLSAPDLLRQADVAMSWAKDHHTAVEMYRGEIDLNTPGRLALLSDLRGALERRQLDVWFQPKIDLVSKVVVGAEALVRWEHPTLGMVPPNQFVPLAETTGLVTELTDIVLGKSMAAVRLLNDVGFRLDVSVNLSTIDLLHEDLVGRVRLHLDAHDVPADQLMLEITETALLEDGQRALSTAEELRALGVQLSIDDFGTGFSSLSYLRTLPASEIKIDRSFVLNLLRDERDEVIVRSTIDLGHNLGLKVAAEGVEEGAALDRLWELGCDLAQGFHIAKPMPLTHFVAWLTTSGNQVARSGIQGAWKPSTSPLEA